VSPKVVINQVLTIETTTFAIKEQKHRDCTDPEPFMVQESLCLRIMVGQGSTVSQLIVLVSPVHIETGRHLDIVQF
jgi:hypothetical protein